MYEEIPNAYLKVWYGIDDAIAEAISETHSEVEELFHKYECGDSTILIRRKDKKEIQEVFRDYAQEMKRIRNQITSYDPYAIIRQGVIEFIKKYYNQTQKE